VTCTKWGVVGIRRVSSGSNSHMVLDAKHIGVSHPQLIEQSCNGEDVQTRTRQGISKRNTSRAIRGQVTCTMRSKEMGPGSLREAFSTMISNRNVS
jgi:hypothetical protein